MISFSSLQSLVQHHLDAKNFSISETRNLAVVNRVYRFLVQKRRWAEFTITNTSLTTVLGTETYDWPVSSGFYEEPRVDILDVNDSNRPYQLHAAVDEVEWSDLWLNGNAFPLAYRRFAVNGVLKIALRPIPDTTGYTISIRGRVEPRAFVATPSSTVSADSASGQAVVNVAATTMFAVGDHVILNEGGAREETGTILSIVAGTSITLTANLAFSHTAAQGDKVERMTDFMQRQSDEALAIYIAAEMKAKRGFPARAQELVALADAMLPPVDLNPRPMSSTIEPYGIC